MYEDKTPENLKQSILTELKNMGSGLSTIEGDFADTMVGPLAVEVSKFYSSLNAIKPMVWVDETSGLYLDLAAKSLGILPRKGGAFAKVNLLINGIADYKIPKGTTFLTDDDFYFVLDHDAIIGNNENIEVIARAKEVGANYNVPANTIIYQFTNDSSIISVTNPTPAMGGVDKESDSSLFLRIDYARKKPSTSGNIYDYERWALEVAGVGAVRVFDLWKGNGTVKVVIADEDRQPVDKAVTLDCYNHLMNVRPVGINGGLTVTSAEAITINISVKLETDKNADFKLINEKIRTALSKHFADISLKYNEVIYNWVGAVIISIDGVKNYQDLLVNKQVKNIILDVGEIPSLGEVVFL